MIWLQNGDPIKESIDLVRSALDTLITDYPILKSMPNHARVQIGQADKPRRKEKEHQKDRESLVDVGSTIMQQ